MRLLLDPAALTAATQGRLLSVGAAAAAEAAELAAEGGGGSWEAVQRERYRDLDPAREHELQVRRWLQARCNAHRCFIHAHARVPGRTEAGTISDSPMPICKSWLAGPALQLAAGSLPCPALPPWSALCSATAACCPLPAACTL